MTDNITWQVTSLEVSKKICELGVKQESLFWWKDFGGDIGQGIEHRYFCDTIDFVNGCSAFTVAELGEMLPTEIYHGGSHTLTHWKVGLPSYPSYQTAYVHDDSDERFGTQEASTEADARGKMLIYLFENKLITLSCTKNSSGV